MKYLCKKRQWWLAVIAVLLVGFIIRILNLMSLPIFLDEFSHVDRARQIVNGASPFIGITQNKWLYVWVLSWFDPRGAQGYWIGRYLSALCGVLSIASTIAIGRMLDKHRTGVIAGLLYAVLPLAAFHERQALVDPLMSAAAAFSMVVIIRHVMYRPRWWESMGWLALGLSIARLTKPSMLPFLLLPGVALALFEWWPESARTIREVFAQLRQNWVQVMGSLGMWAGAVAITFGLSSLVYTLAARDGISTWGNHTVSVGNSILSLPGETLRQVLADHIQAFASIHILYIGWPVIVFVAAALLWAVVTKTRWRAVLFLFIPAFVFSGVPLLAVPPTLTGEIASRYLLLNVSAIALLAALGLQMTWSWAGSRSALIRQWGIPIALIALIAPALWFDSLLIVSPQAATYTAYDRRVYFTDFRHTDYEAVVDLINQEPASEPVLYYPPGYDMSLEGLSQPVIAMGKHWPPRLAEVSETIEQAQDRSTSFFNVVLYDPPFSDPDGLIARNLHDQAYPLDNMWYEGLVYYRQYAVELPDMSLTPRSVVFEDVISLEGAVIQPEAVVGGIVRIAYQWRSPVPIKDSFKVFTHIVDDEGSLVTQHDGVPADGLFPMTIWQPGEMILDRFALVIPEDAAPGTYEVRVGLYQPVSFIRLQVAGDGANPVDRYATIGTINVVR